MFEDFRLKVFEEVASMENFTRAARNLGISQSAVSQCIAELEKKTGVRLFSRSRNSVELTSAGRDLREYVRRILYLYESAAASMKAPAGSAASEVKVLVSGDVASCIWPYVMGPAADGGLCRFAVYTAFGDSCGEDADLKVTSVLHPGLQAGGECAGHSPLCAVARPSVRNITGTPVSLADMSCRLAVWTGPGGGKGRMQEYLSRMAGPGNVLRIVMYSDSADSVVSSVLSSDDLVGIVPMYAIYRQLADRKLVSLPVAGMSGDAAVYMEASSRFASSSLYRYVRQRISGFLELHGRM